MLTKKSPKVLPKGPKMSSKMLKNRFVMFLWYLGKITNAPCKINVFEVLGGQNAAQSQKKKQQKTTTENISSKNCFGNTSCAQGRPHGQIVSVLETKIGLVCICWESFSNLVAHFGPRHHPEHHVDQKVAQSGSPGVKNEVGGFFLKKSTYQDRTNEMHAKCPTNPEW